MKFKIRRLLFTPFMLFYSIFILFFLYKILYGNIDFKLTVTILICQLLFLFFILYPSIFSYYELDEKKFTISVNSKRKTIYFDDENKKDLDSNKLK